jgi:Protein of unknown function (DUF2934)
MGHELHGDEAHRESAHMDPDEAEYRIRLRAHEIWEEEGRPKGRDVDHWTRAKWEIEHASEPEGHIERLERELGHEDEPG